MFDLIFFATAMVVTFFWGTRVEKKHYASIREREAKLPQIPVIHFNRNSFTHDVETVKMISGNAVVGADYFKTVLGSLVSFFGGNISVLESVLDRARREAIIRARKQAPDADFIANLRYETTEISEAGQRSAPKVEVYVYATAIYLKRNAV